MTAPAPAPAPVAPPMYAPAPRTNGLAIATLILGICGFALLPVILGHVALGQIRRSGEGGSAFAIVGLVLGYLALAVYVIVILVIAGSTWLALAS
jgi:hypothetical protein